ncbi:hypothetical protein [Marinicellulosiphila megalodicopiae]|uniref:hypothetical protein n=1 Tax=Marinicellulosiphila megalodicopiae TaxID=2724896 RepID=UPI003BAEF721
MSHLLNAKINRRQLLKQTVLTSSVAALSSVALPSISRQANTAKNVIFFYVPYGAPAGKWGPTQNSAGLVMNEVSAVYESVKEHCVFFTNMETKGAQGRDLGGLQVDNDNIDDPTLIEVFSKEFGVYSTINFLSLTSNRYTAFLDVLNVAQISDPWQARQWVMSHTTNPFDTILQENIQQVQTLIDLTEGKDQSELMRYQNELNAQKNNIELQSVSWDLPEKTGGESFNDLTDLQITNMVNTLKFGMTNIVHFSTGETENQEVLDGSGEYHNILHRTEADYIQHRMAFDQKVANLIQLLKETEDTNGESLLESTLVVLYSNEGNAEAHDHIRSPYLLAGGGFLNGGQISNESSNDRFIDTVIDLMGSSTPFSTGLGPIAGIKAAL